MFELNLGFDNRELYRGCQVAEYKHGKFRLDTPLDSALVMVASNMLEIVKNISPDERGVLVLTGPVPPDIYMTAMAVMGPHFKRVDRLDGKRRTRTTIPRPPQDHDCEPE